MRFSDFGKKVKYDRFLLSKMDFTDWKSAMPLMITLVPFLVVRNSKSPLTAHFSCFCSWIGLTADVRTIGAVYLLSLGQPLLLDLSPYLQRLCPLRLPSRGRRRCAWRLHWRGCLWWQMQLLLSLVFVRLPLYCADSAALLP
jgi:hypothetical protein